MASRRPGLPRAGHLKALIQAPRPPSTISAACPFCSATPVAAARLRPRPRRAVLARRFQSTAAAAASAARPNPRAELEQALVDISKTAPSFVNLHRVHLALQGLRQTPGAEAVRVAILGLADGPDAGTTAKVVLRALLADPLKDEAEWERQLEDHDPTNPLVIIVGAAEEEAAKVAISKKKAVSELYVSSAEWNNLQLEILLMPVHTPDAATVGDNSFQAAEEALLVPTANIPTTMTTPVHKSLLVTDGFRGAVNVAGLPLVAGRESILAAVNLKGVDREQVDADFEVIDIASADKAIQRFRQSAQSAIEYEKLWFASNMPALVSWLKSGAAAPSDEATKPAVRRLIASLLQNTLAALQAEEARALSGALQQPAASAPPAAASRSLNGGLAAWARDAHAELRDQLDLAFTGRRWRKLGWWQLFWRVDDVAMLTNEMLSQRFLPTAEQELVYLTGRVAEAAPRHAPYPQPAPSSDLAPADAEMRRLGSSDEELVPGLVPMANQPSSALPKWPGHIAFTRRYLQNETIPALQALAQRLVLQSLGTSGVTTSLAALLYVSSFSSTVFEAGAVAALGIVWSLGRLQKKWEAARGFWEGEVREEGRKALRGAEESMAEVLDGKQSGGASSSLAGQSEELAKVRELVAKAEVALARMK